MTHWNVEKDPELLCAHYIYTHVIVISSEKKSQLREHFELFHSFISTGSITSKIIKNKK